MVAMNHAHSNGMPKDWKNAVTPDISPNVIANSEPGSRKKMPDIARTAAEQPIANWLRGSISNKISRDKGRPHAITPPPPRNSSPWSSSAEQRCIVGLARPIGLVR